LDGLGDTSLMGSCPHDDLPSELPISETGFDKTYTLLVQAKPSDTLDLVVEQESLLRLSMRSKNPKNQVRAFLYENNEAMRAIAWTSGSRTASSLLYPVKA